MAGDAPRPPPPRAWRLLADDRPGADLERWHPILDRGELLRLDPLGREFRFAIERKPPVLRGATR